MNQIQEYKNALSEVDAVLILMPINIVNRIPKSFLTFIKENKNKSYFTDNLRNNKNFAKKDLQKETKIILSMIYRNYICTPEEKEKYKEEERQELIRYNEELNRRYSYENLFKNKK